MPSLAGVFSVLIGWPKSCPLRMDSSMYTARKRFNKIKLQLTGKVQ